MPTVYLIFQPIIPSHDSLSTDHDDNISITLEPTRFFLLLSPKTAIRLLVPFVSNKYHRSRIQLLH